MSGLKVDSGLEIPAENSKASPARFLKIVFVLMMRMESEEKEGE
jgi:hypothetical protein